MLYFFFFFENRLTLKRFLQYNLHFCCSLWGGIKNLSHNTTICNKTNCRAPHCQVPPSIWSLHLCRKHSTCINKVLIINYQQIKRKVEWGRIYNFPRKFLGTNSHSGFCSLVVTALTIVLTVAERDIRFMFCFFKFLFSLALGPAVTSVLLMATLHGMMRDLISQSGMEPMLPAVETQES